MSTSVPKLLKDCIKNLSEDLDADILLYSADITEENADKLIEIVRAKPLRRSNVVLVLATYGGDPDSAFRITRFLQQAYKKFTLFVFGYCKSAGTLVAIGAHEIVMSDFAELGPLDIQVLKENDFRRASGLDLQQALSVLGTQAFSVFEECFLSTIYRSGGVITTKTAADIASSMAVGLLAPIAGQIDPLGLGEISRSMNVTYEYGIRLNPTLSKSIGKLVSGYPSHGFVIDRREAQELFRVVREPTKLELILEKILSECARSPASEEMIFSLDQLLEDASSNDEELEETDKASEEVNQDKGLDDGENSVIQNGNNETRTSEPERGIPADT